MKSFPRPWMLLLLASTSGRAGLAVWRAPANESVAGSSTIKHKKTGWRLERTRNPVTHHPSRTTRHATRRRAAQRTVTNDGHMPKLTSRITALQSRNRIHHTFLFGTRRRQKAVKGSTQ